MVAKIIVSKNIGKALNYNEQKVQKGHAQCIHAQNFIREKEDMNFHEKLERFTNLIGRNDSKTNTLHISLNFGPTEKLSALELTDIATTYMEKIGFADQPYLVYQHNDAGHPHVHIVTTNIRTDGTRINTHNIGRNQSETARKEIEKEFGLVVASAKNIREAIRIPAIDADKVIYGKSETKRAITNVLDAVIRQYKYTSLPELNAALQQFNVVADRGLENSRTFQNGGLVYRVLDKAGNKVGVPIKASSIHSKPTLKNLEENFVANEEKRKPHRQSVAERIDQALQKPASLAVFIDRLKRRGIDIMLRTNEQGRLYGITFVDHKTKSVFNGSDLGKGYSAAAMQQKLLVSALAEILDKQARRDTPFASQPDKEMTPANEKRFEQSSSRSNEILEQLLKPEKDYGHIPYELAKRKRKKKKRNLGL